MCPGEGGALQLLRRDPEAGDQETARPCGHVTSGEASEVGELLSDARAGE